MQREMLSVVVPVFGNRDTLVELSERIRRIVDRCGLALELIFVDDCSPDDSWEVLRTIVDGSDGRAVALRSPHNVGQHTAALIGLAHARGDWCAVLDADLQDAPELLADLVAASAGHDLVFAGLRAGYQGLTRSMTSHAYRLVRSALVALPRNAGGFFIVRRPCVARMLALRVATIHLLTMLTLVGARMRVVPAVRTRRASGRSEYSLAARVKLAARMLRCVSEHRLRRLAVPVGTAIKSLSGRATLYDNDGGAEGRPG
jgi:glycosyltransferase involved in cell wall biosynthesis